MCLFVAVLTCSAAINYGKAFTGNKAMNATYQIFYGFAIWLVVVFIIVVVILKRRRKYKDIG